MSKVTTAFILGVCAILAGVLNYATYPILLHHLSISDYAELSVYTSLIAILSIPTAGFSYYMLILFRGSFSEVQSHEGAYIEKIKKYTLLYLLGATTLSVVLFFVLGLRSPLALILMILSITPGVLSAFYTGMFQARELFLFLGLMSVFASVLRFLASFLVLWQPLIWVGLLSFIIPGFSIALIYIWQGQKKLRAHHVGATPPQTGQPNTHSVWNYVIIIGAVILLQNIDILMVKMIFSDYDVTLYASISVIAKFALVLIGIFETIFSPTLVDQHKKKQHALAIRILVGFSLLGYLVACTFLPWAGNIVLHILKGELNGSWLLWSSLGISMVSLGFFSLFSKVYMAWGGKVFGFMSVFGGAILFAFFAPNLEIFALIFAIFITGMYLTSLMKIAIHEQRGE